MGEPLRAVREDVEKEWIGKVEEEVKKRQKSEQWAAEVVKQLEKEKQVRIASSFFFTGWLLIMPIRCIGEVEIGRRETRVGGFCH